MAKVINYEGFPAIDYHDISTQVEALDALRAKSDSLPANAVKGSLLSFQVADGYAYYVVTSERPLTLSHVPFLDGYSIPDAHVRGITKADVVYFRLSTRRVSR